MLSLTVRFAVFVLPTVAIVAAPAAVPIVSLIALLCGGEALLRRRFFPGKGWLVAVPAILWAGATVAWSIAPELSARTLAQVFGALLAIVALQGAVPGWSRPRQDAFLQAVTWGLLAGTVILIVDLALDGLLTALVKGWDLADEEQAGWAMRNSNRGVALMAMMAWPAAAFLHRTGRRRLCVLVLVATGAAVLLSHLTNAKLAYFLGLSLLLLAIWATRPAAILLAGLIAGWTLLAPAWISALPDPYRDQSPINRNASVLHRVIIWKFINDKIAERPMIGFGIEAARELPEGRRIVTAPYHAPTAVYPTDFMLVPLHPHNAFLQWWVELGLIGTLLFLAIPLILIRKATENPARPFALAAIGCAFLISAASFGAWQAWWIFTLLFCVALFTSFGTREERYPATSASPSQTAL